MYTTVQLICFLRNSVLTCMVRLIFWKIYENKLVIFNPQIAFQINLLSFKLIFMPFFFFFFKNTVLGSLSMFVHACFEKELSLSCLFQRMIVPLVLI